jgi:RNA polymerase sigma-70 factor (ECF subfamily)
LDARPGLNERRDFHDLGDPQRFEQALLAHLDAAHNLASWLTGNPHDAQDIVQEAYLRAMRSLPTYRGGDLRSWILTIVRNACFDLLRRDKRSLFDETGDDFPQAATDDDADPARILERAEDVGRIQEAITQLPPGIREALVLREMEGMSYKEIATVTGVPIGTVMSRLARGRRGLARLLSGESASVAQENKE